jgi:TPR repeat protein
MKKIFYIAFLLFCTNIVFGQNKLANAIYSLKENKLDRARELIDAAAEDSLFINKASTWYYRGFIYKDLFKRDEKSNKESALRETSIKYFKKSISLEKEGPYAKGCENAIKYFAETFYNQAALSTNPSDYTIAINSFSRYKELIKSVMPNADFTEKNTNFSLALAATYSRISSIDTNNASVYLDKAIKLYKKALILDSNNFSANYNIGIIYYNKGVEIVNKMDYGLDLLELTMLQDQLFEIFRTSLPFMKKAHDLNPNRRETLTGLQGIYFSMNDAEKSELFKKKIEALDIKPVEDERQEIDSLNKQ